MTKPEHYGRTVRRAAIVASATAILLIILKLLAYLASGSASLLAALVDSLMDAAASGINLFALRFATQPADSDHRFGHGKMESLAALGQSLFISGSALLLAIEGVNRLLNPTPVTALPWAIGVMLFSMVATLLLLSYQRRVIQQTGSLAIKADALHYRSDLLLNGGILLALGLSYAGWLHADALFALLIAAYMLWNARHIAVDAAQMLLDRTLPESELMQIRQIASSHPGVIGIHALRTRQSGPTRFIQMHLELPDQLTLKEAHDIAVAIENELLAAFPGADVLIHQDPQSVGSRPD